MISPCMKKREKNKTKQIQIQKIEGRETNKNPNNGYETAEVI